VTEQRLIKYSYFEDGKFSDFTIVCDGTEHNVHRCFIAPQSKYFERACTGMFKEGAERKIELKEDLTSMVDRMVYYFYNFDYYTGSDRTATAPSRSNGLRYSSTSKCTASPTSTTSPALERWRWRSSKLSLPGLI